MSRYGACSGHGRWSGRLFGGDYLFGKFVGRRRGGGHTWVVAPVRGADRVGHEVSLWDGDGAQRTVRAVTETALRPLRDGQGTFLRKLWAWVIHLAPPEALQRRTAPLEAAPSR